VRTEDDLRRLLSDAAQRAAGPSPDARARVGRYVRRQRAWRVGAVAGVAIALAAFGLASLTRPGHRASVRVVSPGPNPSPASVPGPEPDTRSSISTTTPTGTVPAGFIAASITFVSPKDGFVLGSAPCLSARPCTVILRTSDTGRTWQRIPAPAADVGADNAPGSVSHIRFATTTDGWVYGPDLWATHDGGLRWSKIHVDGQVEDLEASAGVAHYIVLVSGDTPAQHELASTPIGHEAWELSANSLDQGAAPVADAHIVLQGRRGWVLVNARTVDAGARLTPDGWVLWHPPCADVFGPAALMAPTAGEVIALCSEGAWGGDKPPSNHLYFSANGGDSFARVRTDVPSPSLEAAAANADTVVVGRSSKDKYELVATFDRGHTWTTVFSTAVVDPIVDLGFTTPDQGVAIQPDADHHTSRLLLTTDGGHHWRALPIRGST